MKIIYYTILVLIGGIVVYKYLEIAIITFAVESTVYHLQKLKDKKKDRRQSTFIYYGEERRVA